MKSRSIADGVFCIHADLGSDELFEGIWPIPHGVSLNAYVVKAGKTALIDLVCNSGADSGQFEDGLSSIGLSFSQIDYLVLNHLEPDHTGWIGEFGWRNPGAEIIATQKGCNLVKSFHKIENALRPVKDGDTLDLGGGRVLTFFEAPNVHWPETMVTWDSASGTLFPCDAFGSFGALGERVFDDEFDETEHAFFEGESRRYYANIVSSFSGFVEKAVRKLEGLDIKCIAPGHGMIWRRDPQRIVNRYLKYASWAKGPAEKSITVIWGSMYGNTKAGVSAVIEGIEQEGVPYAVHRVPDENISWILADAYRSSGLVIAMPTYEYAMFPPMSYVLDIFRRKHIHGKKVLRIGSWGWVGGARKDYEAAIEVLKWESMEPHEWPGHPTETDLETLRERGRDLARAVLSTP
ncbi:MAG: FprA family A-type flavoprotein [Treponema sp.]|nr:FprA family A-type flavoprotein [Treponema sp.]